MNTFKMTLSATYRFRLGALILTILVGETAANYLQAQPNIIHVIADDLGWTDLGTGLTNFGNGSTFYQTPHIDSLASQGMSFTSAYAAQTCSPTRVALMTGQYATRTGVYNVEAIDGSANNLLVGAPNNNRIDTSSTTIGETLQNTGYTTAHFGKFHVAANEADITNEHGFDFNYGGSTTGGPGTYFATTAGRFGGNVSSELDAYAAPYTQSYIDDYLKPYANGADVDSLVGTNKHLTDAVADAAIDFMEDQLTSSSDPFYMNVAFNAVHTPIESRSDLEAKYNNVLTANGGVSPDSRHDDAAYAGLLEGMDQALGRIIDFIDDPNGDGNFNDSIADNTILFFYGDNGGSLSSTDNSPLKGSKGSQSEGGLRVPLIAWAPGRIASGSSSDEPVHAVDFYPTFSEYAGATLPSSIAQPLDGESLTGLLEGQQTETDRDTVFFHYPGYQGQNVPVSTAVMDAGDNRYKLMYFYEKRNYEVYDLDSDIGETNNLAAGEMTDLQYKLATRAVMELRDWLDETEAVYPTVRADGSAVPAPEHTTAFRYELGQTAGNDLDGLTTAVLEKHGVSLTLNAQGSSASFSADATGLGIASALDSGGADIQRRINGTYSTAEAIEFSFDQDVLLKSLDLDALNISGTEEVVLEFVSGDNPFTSLVGYDAAGFTLTGNSLLFAANSADAMEFSLEFGILGQDEIFLSAGTVLSLTANPAVGGGLLLNSIGIAEPLESIARILLDYNSNGSVDAADYDVWVATYGSTTDLRADGNGDGVINAADYTVWRDNLGLGSTNLVSPAQSVPEPTSLLLFTLSLLIASSRWKTRCLLVNFTPLS